MVTKSVTGQNLPNLDSNHGRLIRVVSEFKKKYLKFFSNNLKQFYSKSYSRILKKSTFLRNQYFILGHNFKLISDSFVNWKKNILKKVYSIEMYAWSSFNMRAQFYRNIFWLNGYCNKKNLQTLSEAHPIC